MNRIEHLLTVLSEECAEVSQRACKAARFGMSEVQPGQDDDNKRRLELEVADLIAVVEILDLDVRVKDVEAKKKKLKKYMAYAEKLGTLK